MSHLPEGLWREERVRIWDRVLFHVAAEVVYIGGIACLVSSLRPLNQVSEVEGKYTKPRDIQTWFESQLCHFHFTSMGKLLNLPKLYYYIKKMEIMI